MSKRSKSRALPMTRAEMTERGWDELDFLCITGDAYVDHPSFGTAIIARVVEDEGYRVGVIAQPDWKDRESIAMMGRPRLGVLIGAGNMDSMLSNYSRPGKRRRRDAYSPDGVPGRRPDRATMTYCNLARALWGDIPLIIGGIEASLRRLAHYDYWSDSVRRSILVDSRADILVYGMAELQTREIVRRLDAGERISSITDIPGTAYRTHDPSKIEDALVLPSFGAVSTDKRSYADAFRAAMLESNFKSGRTLVQDQGAWHVAVCRPARPLAVDELDAIYGLPYTREAHPSYAGHEIPATVEVRFSVTAHRGCFGGCSFCAISSHQGKTIQKRSDESIEREVRILAALPDFKGYIHDVGGPSANFHEPSCSKSVTDGACTDRSCLWPRPCKSLSCSHSSCLSLMERLKRVPGVKKIFIRSGIRYDYMLASKDCGRYLEALCRDHVSGQLKIAPEHASKRVLDAMGKGDPSITVKFIELFRKMDRHVGKKQFIVPYFMSSHPGCGLKEALELAEFIRDVGIRPEQVQEFTPTPGSVSTCMYYTGIDPRNGREIYVPRDAREKMMQRALLQYWMPKNRPLVREALIKLGREDLIGRGKKCLVL